MNTCSYYTGHTPARHQCQATATYHVTATTQWDDDDPDSTSTTERHLCPGHVLLWTSERLRQGRTINLSLHLTTQAT